MTGGRLFAVSVPDWGQDHLSVEAIAAYVDDELARGPYERATRHLVNCRDCAGQVLVQGQARAALRSAGCPSMPSALLSSLQAIPQDAELPGPPPGLAMTADGQLVSMLRAVPTATPPAGLAEPPCAPAARRPQTRGAPLSGMSRSTRARLGAGIALTGLVLLALGAATRPGDSPVPSADPGAFGGTPTAAQMQLPPGHGRP